MSNLIWLTACALCVVLILPSLLNRNLRFGHFAISMIAFTVCGAYGLSTASEADLLPRYFGLILTPILLVNCILIFAIITAND